MTDVTEIRAALDFGAQLVPHADALLREREAAIESIERAGSALTRLADKTFERDEIGALIDAVAGTVGPDHRENAVLLRRLQAMYRQ